MALSVRRQSTDPARWDPVAIMQHLPTELSRVFDGWDEFLPSLLDDGFVPIADVEETDDAYVVDMAATLNQKAFEHAKGLIKDGLYVLDERDDWSEHHPTAEQENRYIEQHGFAEYARWYRA